MENEKNYLEYLAELYPTIEKAATEIINLQSVINLPKGTERLQLLSITRESAWRWRKSSRRTSMTGTRSCCTA